MVKHAFYVALAVKYGVNEAIILGQIEYWINKNKELKRNFREGRYWTYNTASRLKDEFPYLTERQINYTIQKLREKNLILTGSFNKNPLDRTTWYTLSDFGLSILQNCKMDLTNLSNANDKIVNCIYKDIQTNNQYNKPELKEKNKQKRKENSFSYDEER